MSVKIHYLVKLSKPVMGVDYRVSCQRAFRFETGKQLRGTENPAEVTCERCKKVNPAAFGKDAK